MESTAILTLPVQTEKAVRGVTEHQHTFYIAAGVNKRMVAAAVKELYGVTPRFVTIINLPPKKTGNGRLKRKKTRKAIVVLKKGDSLDPLKLKK